MNKSYHHGTLHSALLHQAGLMLESEGEAAISLREIGRGLGVSAAAPYRHFADKSALVGALVLGGFDELNATFEGADDLASMFRVYATFARAKPRLLGLMFGYVYREDGEDFEFTRRSNTALSHLLRVVMPLLPAGAGYKERYSAALAAWSMIHGYSLLSAEQGLAGLFENVLADPGELVGRLELA